MLLAPVQASPLPPGTVLETIPENDVPYVNSGVDGQWCDMVKFTPKYDNTTILSTSNKDFKNDFTSIFVKSLWFSASQDNKKTSFAQPSLIVKIDGNTVTSYTLEHFLTLMSLADDNKYEDDYLAMEFSLCKSIDELSSYIMANFGSSWRQVKTKKVEYINIDGTRNARFCADSFICVKRWCHNPKYKHFLYNPLTQVCFYSKDGKTKKSNHVWAFF